MIKSRIKRNTGKVLIKISLGWHGYLAWLGIFHTELHEHVLNVLCLGDEHSLGKLLDLKAKEILQAPIMDISKFLVIVSENHLHKDGLGEPNIMLST